MLYSLRAILKYCESSKRNKLLFLRFQKTASAFSVHNSTCLICHLPSAVFFLQAVLWTPRACLLVGVTNGITVSGLENPQASMSAGDRNFCKQVREGVAFPLPALEKKHVALCTVKMLLVKHLDLRYIDVISCESYSLPVKALILIG